MGFSHTRWPGRLYCTHGDFNSSFCHSDGFHRQLYGYHVELHLALLLPPQTQRPHSRLGHSGIRLLRHLPRHPIRCRGYLHLLPSARRSVPNRFTFLIMSSKKKTSLPREKNQRVISLIISCLIIVSTKKKRSRTFSCIHL